MPYVYEKVASLLLGRIRSGEWQEGEQIPTLDELAGEYPQSRMTLYRALQRLADCGHVTMTRGLGTFVKSAHSRPRIAILTGAAILEDAPTPFISLASRKAHAHFSKLNIDSQFYAEDLLAPTGMPIGLLHEFERSRLSGLLTVESAFSDQHAQSEHWRRYSVPRVDIGSYAKERGIFVDVSSFLSMAAALAGENGKFHACLVETTKPVVRYQSSFSQQCDMHGLSMVPLPELTNRQRLSAEEYGFHVFHEIWNAPVRPNALIIPDDVIAKGVAQAMLARQIRVPDDLLLIALTNRGAGFFYPIPIVGVEVDVEGIVDLAVSQLHALINGEEITEEIILSKPVYSAESTSGQSLVQKERHL